MKFSVIVCTAFRSPLLQRCLESLIVQNLSFDEFEIIVINNSPETDAETQAIIYNIKTPIKIQYAIEEKRGLSHARNLGYSIAKGEILVYIDDDATADPNWLEGILKVYQLFPAAAVGGKVSLVWEIDVPNWLHSDLYGSLSELDYGEEIIQIQRNQTLNGCNFSLKRSCIEKWGEFSHRLGRDQRSLLSGEESEMLVRIQAHGGKCYYTPEALVHHLVPKNRMNKQFFRKRAFWGGKSLARIHMMHYYRHFFGSLAYRAIRVPYYVLCIIWFLIIKNHAKVFLYESRSWYALGYVIGSLSDTMGGYLRGRCLSSR